MDAYVSDDLSEIHCSQYCCKILLDEGPWSRFCGTLNFEGNFKFAILLCNLSFKLLQMEWAVLDLQ